MAIKNLKTLRRFEALAQADVTETNTYNFRSLQEMVEYFRQLERNANEDLADIKGFKRLFEPAKVKSMQRLKIVANSIHRIKTLTPGDRDNPSGAKIKLKEGDDIPVQFVAPKDPSLMKKYSAVGRLHSKIEQMDAMIYNMANTYKSEAGFSAAYSWMKKTRDKMQKELALAYKFLSDVAKKTEPREFKRPVKHLVEKISETYKDLIRGEIKEYSYVTPHQDKSGQIHFVYNHYLELNNLINDKDMEIPRYFVVFTGVVSPANKMKMYWTTLEHYAAPGKFKPQHSFTKEASAWEQIQIAFEAEEDISTFLHRQPLEVTTKQLKKVKWDVPEGFINDMAVEDNVISFGLNGKKIKTKDKAKDIADVLNKDLILRIVSPGKGSVRRRIYKVGTVWMVDFVIALPSKQFLKSVNLNKQLVDRLALEFDWDDKRATEFVRTFNKFVDQNLEVGEEDE